MSLGRWVSKEDVIISKQTFRVVLYPLKRHRGQTFRNMAIGHALFLGARAPLGIVRVKKKVRHDQ